MTACSNNTKTYSNKLRGIGFTITDEWVGSIMLAGLTEIFTPFIMRIETANTAISPDTIAAKLLDFQISDGKKDGALIGKGTSKTEKRRISIIKNVIFVDRRNTLARAVNRKMRRTAETPRIHFVR